MVRAFLDADLLGRIGSIALGCAAIFVFTGDDEHGVAEGVANRLLPHIPDGRRELKGQDMVSHNGLGGFGAYFQTGFGVVPSHDITGSCRLIFDGDADDVAS